MVWLRTSLGYLSVSAVFSILGTSGVHSFPLPSQEQHGGNFTLGAILSWAIPAQGSPVNAPPGISKKWIMKDTKVETGFAESCLTHLTLP